MGDLSGSSTVYVGPGEGRTARMAGAQLITRKVGSEQTGGAYSLFESAVGPGGYEPPHIQHREDECFYVLEGEFEFLIEGVKIEAGTGSLIYVPKGTLHAHQNVGEGVGRILVSQTPGGVYEGFMEQVGEPVTGEAVPQAVEASPVGERLTVIAAEYGIELELSRAGRHSRKETGS